AVRTATVVDVPTATVAALTGTIADPTSLLAPSPPVIPAPSTAGAISARRAGPPGPCPSAPVPERLPARAPGAPPAPGTRPANTRQTSAPPGRRGGRGWLGRGRGPPPPPPPGRPPPPPPPAPPEPPARPVAAAAVAAGGGGGNPPRLSVELVEVQSPQPAGLV